MASPLASDIAAALRSLHNGPEAETLFADLAYVLAPKLEAEVRRSTANVREELLRVFAPGRLRIIVEAMVENGQVLGFETVTNESWTARDTIRTTYRIAKSAWAATERLNEQMACLKSDVDKLRTLCASDCAEFARKVEEASEQVEGARQGICQMYHQVRDMHDQMQDIVSFPPDQIALASQLVDKLQHIGKNFDGTLRDVTVVSLTEDEVNSFASTHDEATHSEA